jgi:hypothetical protein
MHGAAAGCHRYNGKNALLESQLSECTDVPVTEKLWQLLTVAHQLVTRTTISAFNFGQQQAKETKTVVKKFTGASKSVVGSTAMEFKSIPQEPVLGSCAMSDVLAGFTFGRYDAQTAPNRSEDTAYARRIALQQRALHEGILRHKSQNVALPLMTKVSIEALFNARSKPEWALSSRLRQTYSKEYTKDICKGLAGYIPELPTDFQDCVQIKMVTKDNKEFMLNRASRLVDGQRVQSRLLHTVTGERVPIPVSLVEDVLPGAHDSVWLPDNEQLDLGTKYPVKKSEYDEVLATAWSEYVHLCRNSDDPQTLLERPPDSADLWDAGRQVTFHEKIHMETGTSETKDLKKVLDDLIERDPDCFWIVIGDQQTVKNGLTVVFSDKERYKRIIFLPGELHEQMHDCHSTAMLGWTYHVEPVCLLTGSLKVHTAKFYAKEHNEKQRMIFLTLAAGIKYLCDTVTDESLLKSPTKLLQATQRNEPLHDFIFWLVHCALPYRSSVNATRCSDNGVRDFYWRYNMYKYACTNKMNYKLLCLMFGQVCFTPHTPH